MFSEGREDVNDEERAGRPSTSTTDEKINEVEKMILANRRITVREVAEDLNISIGSCHSIFINDLGMRRVAAKFVPKLLNCDQKQHRMNIANEMLDSVRDDPNLLQRVITGDEAHRILQIWPPRLTPGFYRRVKAKTSLQDDLVPIDDTTTKLLFTPQEKGRKGTRDKVPRLRWNPWQKHMLQKAFKDDCISRSQSGKWHKAFKEGRKEVADEPRSGRPTTARTDENVDRVLEVLRTDRRLSIQQIADTLHMSTFVVHGIVTEDLQMRKSCAWHTKSSPRPKKARMSKSRIKTMIIVFLDIRGIVHCEFVPQGQTVNSAFYLEVLRRLKRRIARVKADIKDTVKLHHDNATSHTAFIITNFLARSNTPVIPHPPYSPDLAPCDFFLFPRLKREMKGKHWETVENIQHHVTTFLRSIPVEEFQGAFQAWQTRLRNLRKRWVPRLLSENHRQQRMEAARAFLEMHRRDGDQLFSRIVTGDEIWVQHSTPETKRQSMVWKKPEESAPKKAKVTISAGKVMAIVFWDCKGVLLVDYLPPNTTVNAARYCEWQADLAPKEMAASDMRNRRHVQLLLTWSTNVAHPVSLD
ncbi:hypothetical protein LAZ67_4004296 [Cordylochernes scorpioides]|uniref:Transposase n=1 Tax=Cordylochernes scorpioides TaxID=51811 RepID=A0ABY6KF44_9ARAC|nr:hypothetical protein LAZ67_4004296 [Cordylochernes scorpioides]